MVKKLHKLSLTEEYIQDKYNGKFIKDVIDVCKGNIYLLVDDEPYLIADMTYGMLRVFVDWVDGTEKRPIIKAFSKESFTTPNKVFLEPTKDEIKLVRLLRKMTKYPNGRVIL